MTSDNSNIEVSSFSNGGGKGGNGSDNPGSILIPIVHNRMNRAGKSKSGDGNNNGVSSPSTRKKRKSIWKRLLKRGGNSNSGPSSPSQQQRHANPARRQQRQRQQQTSLFHATFESSAAAAAASPATRAAATGNLLRRRASTRNGGSPRPAPDRPEAGGDVVGAPASPPSAAGPRDPASPPLSPGGSSGARHPQLLLSSSSTITSSSDRQQRGVANAHSSPGLGKRIVDPVLRGPPLPPPHHPGGRGGGWSGGKSVASKGGGGSTVCRGEERTLVTSTTASMTASMSPTEGEGGSVNGPSPLATPTTCARVSGGKENRPIQGGPATPRLRTPAEDPSPVRTRRIDSSPRSASASSSSSKSNNGRPVAAVATPDDNGRGRRNPPSSLRPDLVATALDPAATKAGADPTKGDLFQDPTTAANARTLWEDGPAHPPSEDPSPGGAPATATTASSGGPRRSRPAGAAPPAAGHKGSTMSGARTAPDGSAADPASARRRADGAAATGRPPHRQDAPAPAPAEGRDPDRGDPERPERVAAVSDLGPSLEIPMPASGGKHTFQVRTTVDAVASGALVKEEEAAAEGDTSSSAISMKKNNSNNSNHNSHDKGLSSLVVEEVTRYITNPSTSPPSSHNDENDDQANNNTASSSRGSRVGKAAMSRFTAGKSRGSSTTSMMMPKASKLSRKKKAVPFSRGVGNNGGHDCGLTTRLSQEKKAAHKNDSSPSTPQLFQEAGGGMGPQGERLVVDNNEKTMVGGGAAIAAPAQDVSKSKLSPKSTAPPLGISDSNVAKKKNDHLFDPNHSSAKNAAAGTTSSAKNTSAHSPHLYAEINIPVSTRLSKRQSSTKSSASTAAGGGDNVSLAMTSISSLTGRSSIFALPATEGGIGIGGAAGMAGAMGVGINNMYASMIPDVWCNPRGDEGVDAVNHNVNSHLSRPYQEENYFDYNGNNGDNGCDGGQAEHNMMKMRNPYDGTHSSDEDGIMDRMFGAWNDAFKSTCRCFDVAAGDGEPLWGGGVGSDDTDHRDAAVALENVSVNNEDANRNAADRHRWQG